MREFSRQNQLQSRVVVPSLPCVCNTAQFEWKLKNWKDTFSILVSGVGSRSVLAKTSYSFNTDQVIFNTQYLQKPTDRLTISTCNSHLTMTSKDGVSKERTE